MTWLDGVVLLVLVLAGVGGYAQGVVRGLVRLAALVSLVGIGTVVATWAEQPTATATIQRAVLGFGAMLALVSLVAWSVLRTLRDHAGGQWLQRRWNHILGIVPALLQGVVVVGLLLTLGERLAPEQATQNLIRNGALTHVLIAPFDLLEQRLINP